MNGIRQILIGVVSATLLVVLIIMKKLLEDFGVLDTGKDDPDALHIMHVFPDAPLVLQLHKCAVQIGAVSCTLIATIHAIRGPSLGLVVVSVLSMGATVFAFSSYKNTLKFFLELEEKIIITIMEREKQEERSDHNDEKMDT